MEFSTSKVCDVCGKPKEYVTKLFGKDIHVPIMCECDEKKAQESKCIQEESELYVRKKGAFLSDKQASITFDCDDGKYPCNAFDIAKDYSKKLPDIAKDFGLLFYGEPDGGKTFTCCCIASEAIRAGMIVRVRSVPWIISTYSDFDKRRQIDELISCDLLVLDDLGSERNTSYSQEIVYSIVDGRYLAGKPIIVSTNLSSVELTAPKDVTSRRIYGRLLEMCLPLHFETGRSRASKERYKKMMEEIA